MILGVAQILSTHKADGAESRQVYIDPYNGSEEVRIFTTKMQDDLGLDFVVMGKVVYEGDALVVMETESHISGFIFGYTWKHSSVRLMESDRSGIPKYYVRGILSWRLFGFTLYNQAKDFSGIISSEDMY